MRSTDLQNSTTDNAGHNNVGLDLLLHRFRMLRYETVELLTEIGEELVFKSALHPRLRTPMRTLDLFLFVAEHDDHHLAAIAQNLALSGFKTQLFKF